MPVFNEGDLIEGAAEKLAHGLAEYTDLEYEIVFVENGSTDRTPEILEYLAKENQRIIVHHLPTPDYGGALRYGLEHVRNDHVFVFMADFIDVNFFKECLVEYDQWDIIMCAAELIDRPWYRKILTQSLNRVLGVAVKSPFRNTHGVKYINLERVRTLVAQCKVEAGIFETELVLRSYFSGLRIKETSVPIAGYARPKRSIWYKLVRNVLEVWRLWRVFHAEGIMRHAKGTG
jgi:glycosyltransferase involved in cell wall biosynthesis